MKEIKNLDDLVKFANEIRTKDGYKDPFIWAIGRREYGKFDTKKIIKTDYAVINHKANFASAAILAWALNGCDIKVEFSESEFVAKLDLKAIKKALKIYEFLKKDAKGEAHKNLQILLKIKEILKEKENRHSDFCVCFIYEDESPKSLESLYLKLYTLSQNLVLPKEINLNGAFGLLPNLAWDEQGRAYELDYLRANEIDLKMSGKYPRIVSVDKFPRFLSHIVPQKSVRILDDAKVRLGAYISAGTTVMPGASYINFNSGTLGSAMIEGRISSSVIVGDGTDIGGGASVLGLLSGNNGNATCIGKKCLLGANSVSGIALGDECIIDAGLAILEGTKVFVKEQEKLAKINPNFNFNKEIYKAVELSNLNGLHFRRDSTNGQIIVKPSKRASTGS